MGHVVGPARTIEVAKFVDLVGIAEPAGRAQIRSLAGFHFDRGSLDEGHGFIHVDVDLFLLVTDTTSAESGEFLIG